MKFVNHAGTLALFSAPLALFSAPLALLSAPLALLGAALPIGSAPVFAAIVTQAPAWAVDMASSQLRFQSSVGGDSFTGMFGRWHADIRFDPKNLGGSSVMVKIDMASAKTGSGDRDQALPGADWFATSKYAQATYAAKTFKDLGGGRYQAVGTLTMHGVARPLMLPFLLTIKDKQARMTGTAVIDRHVFGVGQGQFATADTVPFNVHLAVALSAKRT